MITRLIPSLVPLIICHSHQRTSMPQRRCEHLYRPGRTALFSTCSVLHLALAFADFLDLCWRAEHKSSRYGIAALSDLQDCCPLESNYSSGRSGCISIRRSSHDLVRNGLVSVFLRKLEYCEGIMFLTTNRVSQFDEAILTRIHLMLGYDDLNQAARTTIWRHFLVRARTFKGPARIKPEELSRLVTVKFNGRQVSLPIVHPESP
jgi:hypothetical protein